MTHGAVVKSSGWKSASQWNHPEVAGSIPTTGKNNKEYLL